MRTGEAPVLLAVAHGTRTPAGAEVNRALLERVRALRPGLDVRLCFLDHARPTPAEALRRVAAEGRAVVLVPLLLGTGYHIRVDLPALLAAAPPRLRARTAPPLGPDPLLARALADRLAESGRPAGDRAPVVLAAAGSTDPAGNDAARRMARLLAEHLAAPVEPAFLCADGPDPAEAVAALRARGAQGVAVAGYLMAPGRFDREARSAGLAAGARYASAPLADHPALARLVLRRYDASALALAPQRSPLREMRWAQAASPSASHRSGPNTS